MTATVHSPRRSARSYTGALLPFDFVVALVHRARWAARSAAIDRVVRDSEALPFPPEIRRDMRQQALSLLPAFDGSSFYGDEEADDE